MSRDGSDLRYDTYELMKRLVPFLFVLPALAQTVSNSGIQVTLRDDGALSVVQRATGQRWNSGPSRVPRQVKADGRSLEWTLDTAGLELRCSLTLKGNDPAFDVTISAPADVPLKSMIDYPPALQAPSSDYRMVLPHQSGLIYTVQDAGTNPKFTGAYPVHFGNGLSMPWVGVADLDRGMMAVIETTVAAAVTPRVQLAGDQRVFAPQVSWQAIHETFRYPRKVHYRWFEHGGYVAMCKYYREMVKASGRFVSLSEKQKARPQLSKLAGAIDLHMRGDDSDQLEVMKYLEARGVKRMLVNSGASAETLGKMRERGYLTGSYRIYSDIHPPRPGLKEEMARGYPQDAYTLKDGSPVRGFGFTGTLRTTYRCSTLQLPLMKELIPPLVRDRHYEAIFLDVITSSGARDCYNPAHPIDRLGDREQEVGLLRYTTGLGLVTGSEDGADWAAPYLDYFEGMSMTRRFGYVPRVTVNTWPSKFDLNEEYKEVNLNERVRAPLWDLVYHDSVVSTWRWNFTPDRYSDRKWWRKHDLMLMIAGDMPIFMVNRRHLDENGERIVQTYKDVSEWNGRIAQDELVEHRALTADRSVQESRFSSGWAIVVNFSEERPYAGAQGTIAPWDYKIYRWR